MISLTHAKRSDRLMKATTSLRVPEFEALAGRFRDETKLCEVFRGACPAHRQVMGSES